MTLIIAGINSKSAFLSADRRVSHEGKIVDDEFTKCFFIATPDSRGVFAFTGLAKCGSFKTEIWLRDQLNEVIKNERSIEPMLRRITSQLNVDVIDSKIPCVDTRLTILYVGF